MPYTKITFVNDSPPAINATALNQMQTQYDEAKIDIDAHLADNSKHIPFVTTGGVANAYTVTLNPAPAAYYEGMRILVKFHAANTVSTPTINVNGLGAKSIYKQGVNFLTVGELAQNSILGLVYYGAGYFCLDSSRDAHTLRGMFPVTSATANTVIQRDADGRAKVAAPSAADDIARKDTVDAVQSNLTAHLAAAVHMGARGYAVGETTASTTSASYVDLPNMSVTLTTVGGDLVVFFAGTFYHTSAGQDIRVALSLDGAAEVAIQIVAFPTANSVSVITVVHVFTGVSAGNHTVKARWRTSDATAYANSNNRNLLVMEVKASA
jgi:hypothetical protein